METKEINLSSAGNENSYELSGNGQTDVTTFDNSADHSEEQPVTDNSETVAQTESEGAHNMMVGALWCIGGLIVTGVSYSAVKDSGGTYIVAWGAVIYGGWQFLKGLVQTIG